MDAAADDVEEASALIALPNTRSAQKSGAGPGASSFANRAAAARVSSLVLSTVGVLKG